MIAFTLILCTYARDKPNQLKQCFESILNQTVLPSEWIIVKDGPLPDTLNKVIADLSFVNNLKIIALPKNVTQGIARNEGLKIAAHEWIALMDADDVCLPDRFEKQLSFIKADPTLSIVGGQIIEFDDIPGTSLATRNVPTTHKEILTRAKMRNPFSCVTVMFKRDLALEAGGFKYHPGFEDYDLWARMIAKGAKCTNHPDVLVHVRTGLGMYARRRGVGYIRSEWIMQHNLKNLGINNTFEFIRNLLIRIPIRLLPTKMLGRIYEKFARG